MTEVSLCFILQPFQNIDMNSKILKSEAYFGCYIYIMPQIFITLYLSPFTLKAFLPCRSLRNVSSLTRD